MQPKLTTVTINVEFTRKEYLRLSALAAKRGIPVTTVLRRFAQTCNPHGDYWKHPKGSDSNGNNEARQKEMADEKSETKEAINNTNENGSSRNDGFISRR
jgi:hypothetical protein